MIETTIWILDGSVFAQRQKPIFAWYDTGKSIGWGNNSKTAPVVSSK